MWISNNLSQTSSHFTTGKFYWKYSISIKCCLKSYWQNTTHGKWLCSWKLCFHNSKFRMYKVQRAKTEKSCLSSTQASLTQEKPNGCWKQRLPEAFSHFHVNIQIDCWSFSSLSSEGWILTFFFLLRHFKRDNAS